MDMVATLSGQYSSPLVSEFITFNVVLISLLLQATHTVFSISPCHPMDKLSSLVQETKPSDFGMHFPKRERKVRNVVKSGVGEE